MEVCCVGSGLEPIRKDYDEKGHERHRAGSFWQSLNNILMKKGGNVRILPEIQKVADISVLFFFQLVLIFGPFWVIFGPFWQFWVIFGPIWAILGHFWAILGNFRSFLGHFLVLIFCGKICLCYLNHFLQLCNRSMFYWMNDCSSAGCQGFWPIDLVSMGWGNNVADWFQMFGTILIF